MIKLLTGFISGNKIQLILLAAISVFVVTQYIQIEELEKTIKSKNSNIAALNADIATIKQAHDEQLFANEGLIKKVKDLSSTYEQVKRSNKLLAEEIANINTETHIINNEISSYDRRLTDNIIISKPLMVQNRLRAGSFRAYTQLYDASRGER